MSTESGGLASVISRERDLASQAPQADLHYGTTRQLPGGTRLDAELAAHPGLDEAFAAGPAAGGMEQRVSAVPVALGVRNATAIASIRLERGWTAEAPPRFYVYRVLGEPFHVGPLAVVEELCRRVQTGGPLESLVREYWKPTGIWYIQEVLVSSLVVIEEVPPASEREIYIPRWVLYREDLERAQML